MKKLAFWLKQSLLALDQGVNAFIFFGYADESLSARAEREREKPFWNFFRLFINILFFWQEDHCLRAYIHERDRFELPIDYREN